MKPSEPFTPRKNSSVLWHKYRFGRPAKEVSLVSVELLDGLCTSNRVTRCSARAYVRHLVALNPGLLRRVGGGK